MDNQETQPPLQPAIPPAPVYQSPNNSYNWFKTLAIGFAIVAFCIALGIIGYILGTRKNSQVATQPTQKHATQKQQVSVVSPTISNPTANWKTYTNTVYGFSIKYPTDWRLVNEPIPTGNNSLLDITFTPDPVTNGPGGGMLSGIYVSIGTNTKMETLTNYVNNDVVQSTLAYEEKFKSNSGSNPGGFSPITQKALTIDSMPAIQINGLPGAGNPGPSIFFIKNNNIFTLYWEKTLQPNDDQLFNQILSAFKFTDQNQTKNTLIPADSQTPASGICTGPSTDQIVVVTFGIDNVAEPRCVKVTANQKLEIVNNENKTIQGSIGQYSINVAPGQNQVIDAVFGSYLATGVHDIVGAEIWLQ